MLPRFIKIEKLLEEQFSKIVRNITQYGSPLVSDIRGHIVHEGKASSHKSAGRTRKTKFKQFGAETIIPNNETANFGWVQYFEQAKSVGKRLLEHKQKMLFEVMNETTKETGNVLDARGEKLNADHFLKMIEMVQIDFDKDGNPKMPSMFVHPNMMPRINELIQEEDDPVTKKKFDKQMVKKREEFREREANRRLDG